MEVIGFLIFLLVVFYILVVSNKKKEDKRNQYDAFAISGIGQSDHSNALFNTRKIPKNKANNTEFYISDKLAGEIFVSEKTPENNAIREVVSISQKAKNIKQDSPIEIRDIVKEDIEEKESDDLKNMTKQEPDKETEDYQNLINELLIPTKKTDTVNETKDLPEIENRLFEVLQEENSEEYIERKKTAKDAKIDIDNRDTTRRFKRASYANQNIVGNIHQKENDIFESVDKLLREVEEITNKQQPASEDIEPSPLKEENTFDYTENPLEEKYSYLKEFLSSYKNQDTANSSYQDLSSDSFIKKADKILRNCETHIENVKKNHRPNTKIKFEELHSPIKKYEHSEVIDAWKKRLGFYE